MTRVALLDMKPAADNCYTFGGLDYLSDKFATALGDCGVKAGEAVAVILDQSAALAVAELGTLKLGAVAVPLSPRLTFDEVTFALNDSGVKALVAPFDRRDDYAAMARQIDSIETVFLAGDSRDAIHYEGPGRSFWRDVFVASADFITAATAAGDPAFIFYTKTDDGSLRREVHSHAAVHKRLAAFEEFNRHELREGDALWCAEDWASADLLLGLIYSAWWFGAAVVTKPPDGVTGEDAFEVFDRCDVTAAFLRDDLLDEMLRQDGGARARFALKLRTVIAYAEALTADHFQQTRARLGATLCGISRTSGLITAEATINGMGDEG